MNKTDEFMKLAIKEAKKGITKGHGGPFGTVIVKGGAVIGKGHNQVIKNNDPTCHGEMMAIHDACKRLGTFDLSGAVLYTTGYPCPMCLGAILWANIDKVYYGCNTQDAEDIGFRDKMFYELDEDKKQQFIVELDRKQCQKLFKAYEEIQGKANY